MFNSGLFVRKDWSSPLVVDNSAVISVETSGFLYDDRILLVSIFLQGLVGPMLLKKLLSMFVGEKESTFSIMVFFN